MKNLTLIAAIIVALLGNTSKVFSQTKRFLKGDTTITVTPITTFTEKNNTPYVATNMRTGGKILVVSKTPNHGITEYTNGKAIISDGNITYTITDGGTTTVWKQRPGHSPALVSDSSIRNQKEQLSVSYFDNQPDYQKQVSFTL